MCFLFVFVDLGRPDRLWHVFPVIGKMNLPHSLFSWDLIVLSVYFLLNCYLAITYLYRRYSGKEIDVSHNKIIALISIGWAISIHTVTAFIFSGLVSQPYWNKAIIGPQFISSAFVAGPAFLIIIFSITQSVSDFRISDTVFNILRRIIQVSLLIYLFLNINVLFTELYSHNGFSVSYKYLFFGLNEHNSLVCYTWTSLTLNIIALLLFNTSLSKRRPILILASIFVALGIYYEKGIGFVLPGFIPSSLGDIIEYTPTINEILVCLSIWSFGLLLFIMLTKSALSIMIRKD